MLTSKQRAYLRSLAAGLDTIFQIGKGGVGEETVKQISAALEARELIKVRALENSGYTAREAAEEIADATGAEVVATVGSKFVLYKESEKKKRKLPVAIRILTPLGSTVRFASAFPSIEEMIRA